MINKKLLKNNFEKSIKTYNENAIIQKEMADTLVSLVSYKKYNSILEIGSYTGILTEKLVQNVCFDEYLAIDIVDSFKKIECLNNKIKFKNSSIEEFETSKKFDLIVANASLQWCDDFENIIKKLNEMLSFDGEIIVSTFGRDNLKEIKNVFNVGLDYPSCDELKNSFKSAQIIETKKILEFSESIDILRHLKYTGVNSIKKNNLNYLQIKEKLKILENEHSNKLTYNPIFIKLKRF